MIECVMLREIDNAYCVIYSSGKNKIFKSEHTLPMTVKKFMSKRANNRKVSEFKHTNVYTWR